MRRTSSPRPVAAPARYRGGQDCLGPIPWKTLWVPAGVGRHPKVGKRVESSPARLMALSCPSGGMGTMAPPARRARVGHETRLLAGHVQPCGRQHIFLGSDGAFALAAMSHVSG